MRAMTFAVAALLVALDQATKAWASASFAAGGGLPLGFGFTLTYVRNTGAAFGMLRGVEVSAFGVTLDGTVLLALASLAVAVWLSVYLLRRGPGLPTLTRTSLVLVLAGATGNMIDRFRLRYVVDFVHFELGWFDFPVFNLADALIVIGATLLVLTAWVGPDRERSPRRVPRDEAET